MIYDVQKASFIKRLSAFLLDFILLCVLTSGFAFLLAWITNIDSYTDALQGYYEQCEEQYGVDVTSITQEEYNSLSKEEQEKYDAAFDWLNNNADAVKAYNMSVALPMLITTFSILLSYLVFEFIVPLCLKNGQTVGKKVFGLGVVFNNSVRINTFALFVRAIFGKYTIGTMFPVALIMLILYGKMGLLALIIIAAVLILQLVLVIATKNNCFVHDILANTVVVDMSSQMIFDSTQELISYKEEVSKQQAEKKEY